MTAHTLGMVALGLIALVLVVVGLTAGGYLTETELKDVLSFAVEMAKVLIPAIASLSGRS